MVADSFGVSINAGIKLGSAIENGKEGIRG